MDKEAICGKCEYYYYTNHEKTFKEQVKLCWRKEGECKKFMDIFLKKLAEKSKIKLTDLEKWNKIVKNC